MTSKNKLVFLPLGGAGEIGMNMYLYGYGLAGKERFILVDVGVTFPDMDGTPGVDLIMADPAYIEQRADRLDGIFITHAHEDHIGAIGLLYPRLKAPIYCRKFTGAVARAKMEERGQDPNLVEVVGPYPEQVTCGEMKVGFLPVSHSIPEASGLVIDTPAGRIVHTGDLKLDESPMVGEPFNAALFAELGKQGVHALVCDSTNVFSPEPGRSEATLPEPLGKMIKGASGMVVATTFASNIARLRTLAQAGVDAGRSVCVLGRSMQRMLGYAQSTGVLDNFPPTIPLEDIQDVPRDHLMLLVTGSQGERRAASGQLANGKYLGITLKEDDTFLFSSKTIPGNEKSVGRIINSFAMQGVNVIDDSAGIYHVSGHANRPDLERIHDLLKPNMLIPMHGEFRHLREHAELAESKGINAAVAANGTMLDITNKKPVAYDHVETGRVYLDGTRLIGAMDGVVLERIRMATRGMVSVSLVIEEKELLGVWAEPTGLPETNPIEDDLAEQIEAMVEQALMAANAKSLGNDDKVEELTERAVRKVCKDETGKKPVVKVLINRLEAA
ncbi:MBL fold hydrolase [Amylibacter kogurei]|uniref:MBL fold hydrolase n=1 Tax=Paramylibacter kogurei TaxID=1889778 RepID=A0A2G5K4I9_9RHOB|nr:ribonuclease J [Amylibacter kogurei]PIB24335.1 MBL fold hydrolase [Amylibacter kogurei]